MYSLEKNKTLVKSFIEEVFNKRDLTAADKYLSQRKPVAGQGQEGFKQFINAYFLAFPDFHATIEHILGENDLVLVFLNWTGTHKGDFQGMPPTNKPIKVRSADLYRIENNMIVEHWDVVDSLDMLKQTGAITFNQPSTN
jgi:predicted ester cyclase